MKLTDISDGTEVTEMMGEPKTLSPSTYVSLGPTKSAPKVAFPLVQDTDTVEVWLERDKAVRRMASVLGGTGIVTGGSILGYL